MAEINYDLLSLEDLKALKENRLDDISIPALKYLSGEGFSAWEAFSSNAARAMQSSGETISRWIHDDPMIEKATLERERESRIMQETNPVASVAGQLVGSIADPVTLPAFALKPIRVAGSAFKTGLARGAVAGTIGGALQPVYEEFGDTRTMNIAAGAALGGGIGGAAGAVLRKFGIDISLDPNEMKAKIDALPSDQKEQLLLEWDGVYKTLPEPEKQKMLEWNGQFTPREPAIDMPTKPVEWNPEIKSLETVEQVPSTVDLTMPTQVKKPIKINKVATEFADDLDHAFWQVETNKGVQKQAATSWLMDRTGLNQKQVELMAKQAQRELARRVGGMTPDGGKLKFTTPSKTSSLIKARVAPDQTIRTPYQPKRIDIKDGLDPEDIKKLRLTGVIVTQNKKGEVRFRDDLSPRKPFINAAELKHRLNAIGIDLDVPGYREKIKAAQSVPKEDLTKVAADAPEVKAGVAKADDVVKSMDIPEDIGVPKAGKSLGSAGVDPKTYLTEDLMPKTYGAIIKGGEARDRVLLRMLETDDPRISIPKDIDPKVVGKGTLLAIKQKARATLQKILDDHGNFPAFMIARKGEARGMSADETAAFQWFYADAMANRAKVIDDLVEMRKRGDSFDSPRGAELARDLTYYEGVDMFWKNEGTKVSRALNARRIIYQYGSKLKTIFPGVSC
jgi:hypothetical protein